MALLLNNEYFSDFRLIDKIGNKLWLHKIILSNRLPYYLALFSRKFKECNSLEVSNIKIYMPIFEYLYKGTITVEALSLKEWNELISYAEEILLLKEDDFRDKITFEFINQIMGWPFSNEVLIDPTKMEISIEIINSYSSDNIFWNCCLWKLIHAHDDEKLMMFLKNKSYRNFLRHHKKHFELIIKHYAEIEDPEIFNELNYVVDVQKLIFENIDNLILFTKIYKSNILYFKKDKIIQYWPLIISIKIGKINSIIDENEKRIIINNKRKEYQSDNIIINLLDNNIINKNDKIIIRKKEGEEECKRNKTERIKIESLNYYDEKKNSFSEKCETCIETNTVFIKLEKIIDFNDLEEYPFISIHRFIE